MHAEEPCGKKILSDDKILRTDLQSTWKGSCNCQVVAWTWQNDLLVMGWNWNVLAACKLGTVRYHWSCNIM